MTIYNTHVQFSEENSNRLVKISISELIQLCLCHRLLGKKQLQSDKLFQDDDEDDYGDCDPRDISIV